MADYRFTPEADSELFEIWSYIAADNPDAADRVEAAVYDACALLAKSPTPPAWTVAERIRRKAKPEPGKTATEKGRS